MSPELRLPKDLLVKVLTLILSHYMEINSIVFGWVLDNSLGKSRLDGGVGLH